MSAQTIEILKDVAVPVITGIIGLFSGMHIERHKTKNIVKNKMNLKDESSVENLNAGITNVYKK